MNDKVDETKLDSRAEDLMRLRIIKAERDNEKSKSKSPAQMVDTICKIIEEEADSI